MTDRPVALDKTGVRFEVFREFVAVPQPAEVETILCGGGARHPASVAEVPATGQRDVL